MFQGIGKLKDYQLKLHVDPSVTPVVQKMRRVPFSVKDNVTAKVNELLEKDIIEKVEGPTVWVSPVVVAPKPSGDIRLCVDMQRANEAIIRERLPIPTIDEVLESLKVSANPKFTVLHNFGFLYDSINLRNSFGLKKYSQKNLICTGSYLAKTILPS